MVSYIEQDESGKVISSYEKKIVRHRNDKGQLHREDGPAVEWPEGTKFWYRNGRLHREDGPAIHWETGAQEWYLNGHRHRLDGPAIELPDGRKWWWIDGERLAEQEFNTLGRCDCSQ